MRKAEGSFLSLRVSEVWRRIRTAAISAMPAYGVSSESRGLHIGEKLVRHSMELGRELMKLFVLII